MPYRKIARALSDAFRDEHKARRAHSDPRFDKELQQDRRTTLRRFHTVERALRDREKAEKQKAAAGEKPGPGATQASKTTKAKAKKK
ncbi:MAG TPA: hypothetical protein VI814_06905 [Candidatus Limnocylindria bacterium]